MKTKNLLICILVLFSSGSSSQTKLIENFDFAAGDSIGAHGWTANTGGTVNRILVTSPGLNVVEYPLSGIGNAATLTTTGQDAFKQFSDAAVTSGPVFASFMIRVTGAARPGDYFAALLPSTSTSLYLGRVLVRSNAGFVEFGLTKASPSDTNTMSWVSGYSLNTDYLVVLKYQFFPGPSNDEVSLFIFPFGIPLMEPPPNIGPVSFPLTSADANNIGRFALRQGTAGRSPDVIVDGILVSTSWFVSAAFYQRNFNFGGPTEFNSDWGAMKLIFTGFPGTKYLNLSTASTGTTTMWQIENVPLSSFSDPGIIQEQLFSFDIGIKGVDVTSIDYGLQITDFPLDFPPPLSSNAKVTDDDVVFLSGAADSNRVIGVPKSREAVPLKGKEEGVMPDTGLHQVNDFPNQECGPHECVPAAISNSLKFLRKKHSLDFDSNFTKLDSAKKAVKFGEDFPDGTSLFHWEEYKRDYMEKNKIPITTRTKDTSYMTSLGEELDNNQDVELAVEIRVIDPVTHDTAYGDHCVNVTGFKRMGNGKFQLTVQSDLLQGQTGGNITETLEYDSTTNKFTSGCILDWYVFKIVIECPSPPEPVPVEPENGSSQNSIDPHMDWNTILSPGTAFTIQISPDPEFSLLVLDSSGILNSEMDVPPGNLNMGPLDVLTPASLGFGEPSGGSPLAGRGDATERATLEAVIVRHSGRVSQAAEELGLSRQALYRRMERLGITLERRPRD